jgi:glutamate-ammonia-ligase adenylyltransferase
LCVYVEGGSNETVEMVDGVGLDRIGGSKRPCRSARSRQCALGPGEQLSGDVQTMRDKMRKQLDKSNAAEFDLKQGNGGIADIEFLVQYLVLKNAAEHPAVIHYSDNIRQLGTLSAANCLDEADALRMQQIYKEYRLKMHRLALDGRPPIVDGAEFLQERKEVCDIWNREMAGPDAPTLL